MNKLNVVHFCSWWWTTMRDVAKKANMGMLWDIKSAAVIVSKPEIKAIKKAKELGIPVEVIENAKNPEKILRLLRKYRANIASLNWWIPRLPEEVITEFSSTWGILLNQHPGPLRAGWLDFWWAGKLWMYWSRVTAARVLYLLSIWAEWDDVFTESSVQYVAPEVDRWTVVWIKRVNFADKLKLFRRNWWANWWENAIGDIDFSTDDESVVRGIKYFVDAIQEILLSQEHKNVANVFFRLGHWEKPLLEAEEFSQVLVPEVNKDVLIKAKERAVLLYPKG